MSDQPDKLLPPDWCDDPAWHTPPNQFTGYGDGTERDLREWAHPPRGAAIVQMAETVCREGFAPLRRDRNRGRPSTWDETMTERAADGLGDLGAIRICETPTGERNAVLSGRPPLAKWATERAKERAAAMRAAAGKN